MVSPSCLRSAKIWRRQDQCDNGTTYLLPNPALIPQGPSAGSRHFRLFRVGTGRVSRWDNFRTGKYQVKSVRHRGESWPPGGSDSGEGGWLRVSRIWARPLEPAGDSRGRLCRGSGYAWVGSSRVGRGFILDELRRRLRPVQDGASELLAARFHRTEWPA